jgi:uncharacterized membrane protein YheB (UPF0754 family)
MDAPSLSTWIAVPLIGGVIGWTTNWIAVKMIFRPIKPRRLLFFRLHGLVPRRQQDLARSIGKVVGKHLVEHRDIVRGLNRIDFGSMLGGMLDRGLQPKIQELRTLPLIGGFLTDDRVADIKTAIEKSILEHKEAVLDELEKGLAAGLDVPNLVEEKVAGFAVERLESMILDVARRELKAITWFGGVLGVLIGCGQVAWIWWMS